MVAKQTNKQTKVEVKAMQSEIKENMQVTNSEGKETRTQINNLEQKEEIEINIQPEQNEETRIPKNEERLKNVQEDYLNIPTSES